MGTSNKGRWYKLLIQKMDQSIADKYYFETIFIEYMIIDDRLKSLANLAGVELVKSDGSPKMVGQLIDDLKARLVELTSQEKSNLEEKRIPQWAMLKVGIPIGSKDLVKAIKKRKYPMELIDECINSRAIINVEKSPKTGKLLSKYGSNNEPILTQIQKWIDLRNHWMHAAGNDALTLDEYEADITPLAIDGATFTRELCAITMKIKRSIKRVSKNITEKK